jgi:peptidoglycan/xylan/chitin deacetylase (PgdA/CDA1 family)
LKRADVLRRGIEQPRAHWVLFGLVLALLLASLLAEGVVQGSIGRSSTPSSARAAGGFSTTASLVDISSGEVRAVGPGRKVVALTFDDGPDPIWTPKILSVLRRYDVPATFFVVGSRVLQWPEIVRDEVEAGGEIGSHTLTHADMGAIPPWRQSLELAVTQSAIEGATSTTTSLLRLPYSSKAKWLSARQEQAAKRAAADGYLLSFSDLDSED